MAQRTPDEGDPIRVVTPADSTLMGRDDLYVDGVRYSGFCEAVIACADVGLLVVDTEGNYAMLNPALQRMMALAFPDGPPLVAGQPGAMYAADGVTPIEPADLPSSRAVRGEEFDDYLIWAGPDPETRRALSASARRLCDADGETIGTVVVGRDTTELVRAVRAREDFLAAISHEIRTPLTSVLGYLEIAREESIDVPQELREHLAIVQRNSERVLRLVDQLLQAARLSHGVNLEKVPTDLGDLVARAVESSRPAAAEAEIALAAETVTDPVREVELDPDRITEVLDNLLSNAIKFTPAGGSITVRVGASETHARVAVQDSGIGIPSYDQESVFEQFFRSSGAHDHAVPGVGIGLHLVKVIVDSHGGLVHASANEGAPGTTVVVELPLR